MLEGLQQLVPFVSGVFWFEVGAEGLQQLLVDFVGGAVWRAIEEYLAFMADVILLSSMVMW